MKIHELAVSIFSIVILSGCESSPSSTAMKQSKVEELPIINVVAIDRSGSTQNMRETQITVRTIS